MCFWLCSAQPRTSFSVKRVHLLRSLLGKAPGWIARPWLGLLGLLRILCCRRSDSVVAILRALGLVENLEQPFEMLLMLTGHLFAHLPQLRVLHMLGEISELGHLKLLGVE